MTYSHTTETTFTRTEAKYLASKVIADLYQCAVFYDSPPLDAITDYEAELVEWLDHGYIDRYEFGFKRDERRVVTYRYKVAADGGLRGDSNAGALHARADVTFATYYNSLTWNDRYLRLTPNEQAAFKAKLPFQRSPASLPGDGDGYWQTDHSYSAGGVVVNRESFRPW